MSDKQFEIEKDITETEKTHVKTQTLLVIKSKYLQYKAEYLTAKGLGDEQKAQEMLRLMREADISYRIVKEEL